MHRNGVAGIVESQCACPHSTYVGVHFALMRSGGVLGVQAAANRIQQARYAAAQHRGRDVDYNDQSPLDASTFVHRPVVSRAGLERPLENPRTHCSPLSLAPLSSK
ncbi:unnamed protein product [Ectocarpus sp. 13 AM-2016]